MTMTTTTRHRKLTQAELLAEATARFGDDPLKFAFRCPRCGDVATIQEFVAAGDGNRAGQECIGRLLGGLSRRTDGTKGGPKKGERGCDWAAYGLFRGPWEVVVPAEDGQPERSVWSFPLADAPSGPAPAAEVWIAAARREIEAHRPDGDLTGCRRSMRTGHRLTAAEATERHGAKWCPRCWPAPS